MQLVGSKGSPNRRQRLLILRADGILRSECSGQAANVTSCGRPARGSPSRPRPACGRGRRRCRDLNATVAILQALDHRGAAVRIRAGQELFDVAQIATCCASAIVRTPLSWLVLLKRQVSVEANPRRSPRSWTKTAMDEVVAVNRLSSGQQIGGFEPG